MFSNIRGERSKKNSRVLREKESQRARISAESFSRRDGRVGVAHPRKWRIGVSATGSWETCQLSPTSPSKQEWYDVCLDRQPIDNGGLCVSACHKNPKLAAIAQLRQSGCAFIMISYCWDNAKIPKHTALNKLLLKYAQSGSCAGSGWGLIAWAPPPSSMQSWLRRPQDFELFIKWFSVNNALQWLDPLYCNWLVYSSLSPSFLQWRYR